MVAAKETAEEQLLRMIEGSGPTPPSGRPGRPAAAGWERLLAPLGQGRRILGQWFGRPKGERDRSDTFLWQLQLTSRLFWLLLAGLGVYLVVDLGMNQPKPPTLLAPGGTRHGGTPGWTLEDQSKQLANYRSTLASRNPFRLSAPGSAGLDPETVKNKLVELTQTLTVVGINKGRVPEALIEDTDAKRTHFVKVGDQINGLTISRIDENGVTVSYEGEELTLK